MHLNIDGQEYHINLHKVTDDIRLIYENHVIKGIPFPNGYKITFEKKSIPVLALKQVLTMMVIPMLVDLYKLKGYEIERKKKHEDAPLLPIGRTIESQTPVLQQGFKKQKIKEGEHWGVYGKSGMGKTTLIKALIDKMCESYPYCVYHIDTKHQGDFTSQDGRIVVSEFAPPVLDTPGARMVWQPLLDNIDEYSKFFTNILNAGIPSIVNIDESANMVFGTAIPRGLMLLLKQGRLPGIHVILGAQELA